MKEDILSLKNELEFTLEEVNIEKDSDLLEKYKEKIPVLTLNGRIIAKYSVDRKKLMNILF
jgi:glutaredoxin